MTGAAPGPVIDWHAHWIPPEIESYFAARRTPPCLIEEDGRRFFLPDGRGDRLPIKEHQLDINGRLAEMDKAGIDRQVLSLAVFFGAGFDRMPPALEDEIVAANNEGLSRLVRAHPNRFAGLGLIPVRDPSKAASALRRAVEELGLLGAVLPAEAFADPAAALRYGDLFGTASDLGAHLFIHPGAWQSDDGTGDGTAALIRRRAASFQDRMTRAALAFAFTDVLAPYPDAVVHLANLGGNIALLAERIAMTAGRMGLADPKGRLGQLIYDTASFGRHGIALAAATLGAERLVLGSDSPALPLAQALDGIFAAPLDGTIRRAILEGHALAGHSFTAP